jgi:FkbM family methyltransferase
MRLSRCRAAVDAFAPPVGRLYRALRNQRYARKRIQTRWGFNFAGDPGLASGEWEAHEIQAFLAFLETHDVVLDIGANVGFYTCLAASRGKQTIAIEPCSSSLNVLYRNLWENNFLNVEVLPVGLARQPGLGRIYGLGGIASFVRGWGQAPESQFALVPLGTLDTIAATRFQGKKLLIKMDVEGFELEVLAGAPKTLDLHPKPTWLVELLLHDHVIPGGIARNFRDAFEIFWENGYRSRMLDAARTPVGPADVDRWVAHGRLDTNNHDFLFSAV